MFNLSKEVKRLYQLRHDKTHGLPYKPKQHDTKVKQVDGTPFESIAEQEHTFMLRRFRNHSADFGRRLSKRKGQYHRPGGGYAGHSVKGI
jgi:hypothetical protein